MTEPLTGRHRTHDHRDERAAARDDLRARDADDPGAGLPEPVSTATARTFGWLSTLRRARIFHPRGVAFRGRARLHDPAVGVLAGARELDAIVRISRGVGLPVPAPDVNGIAVRLVDAHGPGRDQDLLLATTPRSPVLRHLLRPTLSLRGSGFTTLLPYRTPDGTRLFATGPLDASTLEELGERLPFTVSVSWAAPPEARWEPVVEATLTERLPPEAADALAFDPWHTGDRLRPAGMLNRLRLPAYAASRAARRVHSEHPPGPAPGEGVRR